MTYIFCLQATLATCTGQLLRAIIGYEYGSIISIAPWLRARPSYAATSLQSVKFMQINSRINIATHHHWTIARPTLSLIANGWSRRLTSGICSFECPWCEVVVVESFVFRFLFFVFRSCSGNLLPTWCVDSCRPTTVIRNSSFCEIGVWRKCFLTSKAGNTYYRITNWVISRPSCSLNCFVLRIFYGSPLCDDVVQKWYIVLRSC